MLSKIDIPPTWLAVAIGLSWMLAQDLPIMSTHAGWLRGVGYGFVALGVGVMGWAGLTMLIAKTSVFPRKPPTTLVTTGPFRLSRNPIYLADVFILLGWLCLLGALSPLIFLPAFIALLTIRFIKGEEAALAERFPDAFASWSARVRRWI